MKLINNPNATMGSPACARTYALVSAEIRKLTGSADAEITMGYIVSKLLYCMDEQSTKGDNKRHYTMFKGKPYFRVNEIFLAEQLGYSTRQASNVIQQLRNGFGLIEEQASINYEMFLQSHADRTHCITVTDEGLRYYPELKEAIDRWNYWNPGGFWKEGPRRRRARKQAAVPKPEEPVEVPKPEEPAEAPEAPEAPKEPEPKAPTKEEVISNISNLSILGPDDGLPF